MQKKIVLVYYSQRGSTAKLAAKLAEALDLKPIVLEEAKPRDFDIEAGTGGFSLAAAALAAKFGLRSRLKPLSAEIAVRIADADMVVLGTPIWAGSPSPAINAFIDGRLKPGATVHAFGTMKAPNAETASAALRKRIERRGGRVDQFLFVTWNELDSEAVAAGIAEFVARIG